VSAVPGSTTALVFLMHIDNSGPQSVDEVLKGGDVLTLLLSFLAASLPRWWFSPSLKQEYARPLHSVESFLHVRERLI
jgi:hypothetical protein